jgi:hypothetical protein
MGQSCCINVQNTRLAPQAIHPTIPTRLQPLTGGLTPPSSRIESVGWHNYVTRFTTFRRRCRVGESRCCPAKDYGALLASRYRLKQADGISLVRSNREGGKQSLAFVSRPFILCGVPVRGLPSDQLLFERRNAPSDSRSRDTSRSGFPSVATVRRCHRAIRGERHNSPGDSAARGRSARLQSGLCACA